MQHFPTIRGAVARIAAVPKQCVKKTSLHPSFRLIASNFMPRKRSRRRWYLRWSRHYPTPVYTSRVIQTRSISKLAVLLQKQLENRTKPIGYWPRSLTDAEKQYDTTERECLAIILAVSLTAILRMSLVHHLYGLWGIKMKSQLTRRHGRLARWHLRFQNSTLKSCAT